MDDLDRTAFEVLEEGLPQRLLAFEARATSLNAALLLDSTLSMYPSRPALKNAALDLLRKLRPGDSAAVYSFSDDVNVLQPATTDRPAAARKAKAAGIPVYTIAQGMALGNRALLRELEAISKGSGGLAFAIRDAREVGAVFDAIARDLSHRYLLTIHPDAGERSGWRRLQVQLKGRPGYQVRAREGYQSE